jgi:hypothetical protein
LEELRVGRDLRAWTIALERRAARDKRDKGTPLDWNGTSRGLDSFGHDKPSAMTPSLSITLNDSCRCMR